MILMRYTKTDGAEFISHLDMLRHLGKTFKRAGISVAMSGGYHPHMLVYLSAPIGVGMKSLSEYCLVETEEGAEGFAGKFNAFAPRGIRCTGAYFTPKKVGVASDLVKARYFIEGVPKFDEEAFLSNGEFFIEDKNGRTKNVRDRIYSVRCEEGGVRCLLGFGNGLRAEKFAEVLKRIYGGEIIDIVKEAAFTEKDEELENTLR
ncbi:MAG: TIGR03936 family radical SAM-associated protein [Candidatus Borkfalkiaceae bacterium]|nr:TIGR03936 family radical SAM-associated protein [Christensenellaceae bacterium]